MTLHRILGGHLKREEITHLYHYAYLIKITLCIYVKIT
jgi:hypothetical protein